MDNNKHIINKVFFEVDTPDTKAAYYLRDNLDVFLKQSLLPTLKAYFDNLSGTGDQILRFDTLELNINSANVKDQIQLQLDIIKSLQKQITEKKKINPLETENASFSKINQEKSDLETFFYFLKTGQNPWWSSTSGKKVFNQDFIENQALNKDFISKLKAILHKKSIRKRLVFQFADEVLIALCSRKTASRTNLKRLQKYFRSNTFRDQYWEIVLKYISDHNQASLKTGLSGLVTNVINKKHENRTLENQVSTAFLEKELKKLPPVFPLKVSSLQTIRTIIVKAMKSGEKPESMIEIIERNLQKELHLKNHPAVLKEWIRKLINKALKKVEKEMENVCSEILMVTSDMLQKELNSSLSVQLKNSNTEVKEDQEPINLQDPETEVEEETEIQEVYIENAGLVLLHPYLTRFFVATKLAEDNGSIKPDKMELAIHLLHYLATKKEQQPESNMVFEKFLCGFPIHKPIKKEVELSWNLKKEAEKLLEGILQNWEVLKNTTPDGLREGFIQRDGKIILHDDSKYRIIVERKTQDILLDKLPWNLNLIRLPWIDKLIFVEW